MTNDLIDEKPRWMPCPGYLPDAMREVAVKGRDTQGEWHITGGVWWQPYRIQPHHHKGRWMQKDGAGKPMRLPESDDVTDWMYV
jgi:hypothetical protein